MKYFTKNKIDHFTNLVLDLINFFCVNLTFIKFSVKLFIIKTLIFSLSFKEQIDNYLFEKFEKQNCNETDKCLSVINQFNEL